MNNKDTITAIITPYGRSSVGIIRISGNLSILVAKKITKNIPKIRTSEYMYFYNKNNKIIDKGIVLFFNKPNSFTGEDILELHCHGNPIILDDILLNICSINGIRLAKEGEFTERAFLNNKIDLIQAEAISDLINANSIQSANLAIKSIKGDLSDKFNKLIEINLNIISYIEAYIDFSVNELNDISIKYIEKMINNLLIEIEYLICLNKKNYPLYEGIKFVICGEPNVGKSSLFNILSGKKAAIVTNIPGTTRDVLHQFININGTIINIIDTAGLHIPKNEVESIGIEYAKDEIKNADHLLFIIDMMKYHSFEYILKKIKNLKIIDYLKDKSLITIILNKADINNEKIETKEIDGYTIITISAKLNLGINIIYKRFDKIIKNFSYLKKENKYLINKRHIFALEKAKIHILNAKNKYLDISKFEILAEEIKYSQKYLYELTGKIISDKLLENIFSRFCVGK